MKSGLRAGQGRKECITCRTKLRIVTDFLSESFQTRKKWSETFKLLKERKKKDIQKSTCNKIVL